MHCHQQLHLCHAQQAHFAIASQGARGIGGALRQREHDLEHRAVACVARLTLCHSCKRHHGIVKGCLSGGLGPAGQCRSSLRC